LQCLSKNRTVHVGPPGSVSSTISCQFETLLN
jgi:hypothetical protein